MTLGITGKLILGFLTLLIGAVLITVVASESLGVTDKTVIDEEAEAFTVTPVSSDSPNTTETHTVTNAPTGWKVADCPLTSVTIKNATGDAALTEDTDYTLTESAGTWVFINSTATQGLVSNAAANTTYVTYTYCQDGYLTLGWGRTVVNLVAGFFALAILLASIGIFFSVAKDTGLL